MSGTISGSITIAYTLSVNPTTILNSGTIAVTAGNAIYGGTAVAWSLSNSGLAQGGTAGIGVSLNGSGTVTNTAGGSITGGRGAIAIISGAGSLYNAGSLSATGGAGVSGSVVAIHADGGSVGNAVGGLISGGQVGVDLGTSSIASTVTNRGRITGASQAGVSVSAGYVSNAAAGVISAGDFAVAFAYAGTMVNAGTLQATAANGDAVDFPTGYANRLVDLPGAMFIGSVNGGNTAGSTMASILELASAGSAGTLTGFGTQFTNFATIAVDARASWRISGSAGGAFAAQLQTGAGITLAAGGTLASTNGPAGAVVQAPNGGTLVNYGDIDGVGETGVQLHGGVATNVAGATISGLYDGLDMTAPAVALVNHGIVTGSLVNGLLLEGGSASNAAGGGVILGGVEGVFAEAAPVTLTNAGSIGQTGSAGNGIGIYAGGTVTNYGGAVSGVIGIYVTGGAGLVTNQGSIVGAGGSRAAGIVLFAGGGVVNRTGGTIAGYHAGIYVHGGGSVVNSGGVTASAGDGVTLNIGGSVTNAATAAIGGAKVGIAVSGGAGSVVNAGSIAGAAYSGVALASGGLLSNQASGSISGGGVGVYIGGATGTVVNDGSIAGSGTAGVVLGSGGSVSNASGASITGVNEGVLLSAAGTVVNAGSIQGGQSGVDLAGGGSVTNVGAGSIVGGIAGGTGTVAVVNYGGIAGGVELASGGSVTNAITATITATGDGIDISGGAGSVANSGTIGAGATGVFLHAGGSVSNAGSISGNVGAYLFGGGTLANAGTISGGSGTAVAFGGTVASRLVLDPGYGFSGLVIGSASAANSLELASAATAGAVGGLGTGVVNFGAITIDAGAHWTLTGDTAGLAGAISGFAKHDAIEVSGVTATTWNFSGQILTLTEAVGFATLDLPGTLAPASFIVTPNAEGTEVTIACFAEGTRLLTATGEVPVEALAPGERLATCSGRLRPVRWIGHRRVDAAFPVCVQPDAFAPGVPHRAVRLSPDHAVWYDGALIPVRYLCNGATIRQTAASVTYYHVELDAHDVVLADGLLAESYLDTGNRGAFANDAEAAHVRMKEPA